MKALKIKGIVKNYAWGNTDFIPSLVGGFDGQPQAELWMGTHPSGDALVEDYGVLSKYIEEHPEVVGKEKFPLLFKVLAISKPLSLQCHPSLDQAREGWEREKNIRESGKEYNYQDDNEKEEIIAALSPITALCGFREIDKIKEDLSTLIPISYEKYLAGFDSVKTLFFGLYGLSSDRKAFILDEFSKSIDSSSASSWKGNFLTAKGIAKTCLVEYPNDIGALFPYILNVVHLQIGEALYLKPGTLHAYVYGNGIELMNASDNVLRGGLTKKRVDLNELERIMKLESEDIKKVSYCIDGFGRRSYETPSNTFRLLEVSTGDYVITKPSCSLLIVTEGKIKLREADETMILEKGEIVLIPITDTQYTLNVHGEAFMAEVL